MIVEWGKEKRFSGSSSSGKRIYRFPFRAINGWATANPPSVAFLSNAVRVRACMQQLAPCSSLLLLVDSSTLRFRFRSEETRPHEAICCLLFSFFFFRTLQCTDVSACTMPLSAVAIRVCMIERTCEKGSLFDLLAPLPPIPAVSTLWSTGAQPASSSSRRPILHDPLASLINNKKRNKYIFHTLVWLVWARCWWWCG